MSAGFTFPWEQGAMGGEELPEGLSLPDQMAYISLRGLYRQYRSGVLDRETAAAEKRKIVKAARDAETMEAFRDKLARSTVTLWKEIEAAGNAYAREPTLETADAFYQAVYRVRRKAGVEEVIHEED